MAFNKDSHNNLAAPQSHRYFCSEPSSEGGPPTPVKTPSKMEEEPVFPSDTQQHSVLSPCSQGLSIPVFEFFFM